LKKKKKKNRVYKEKNRIKPRKKNLQTKRNRSWGPKSEEGVIRREGGKREKRSD